MNASSRVHSPTNGGFASCACVPASRSTASTAETRSRASSIWRASVARLSCLRRSVGGCTPPVWPAPAPRANRQAITGSLRPSR